MSERFRGFVLKAAPYAATLAFAALLVTFAGTLVGFRDDVERWARRDLELRSHLAAETLRETLVTQNFKRLVDVANALVREGELYLTVYSPGGAGILFSLRPASGEWVSATGEAAGYRVELSRDARDVYRPFHEALLGFVLAALVGVVGMFAVFFALYRQRVRIRELAQLERFRREFIADVSHEIKTPLTGILGATDMLTDVIAQENETAKRLMKMIVDSSVRLKSLVQQILDLSRLEREEVSIVRTETDLSQLVTDMARRYGVCVETGGDVIVFPCDARLVEQALSNLVENAQRHAKATKITVSVRRDKAGGVILAVEDDGIGIPSEHRARIFERFYRIDPSRAAESGGAGLGLSIVRRIARLHGGDAACESVLPHGSRFILNLPGSTVE